MSLKTKSFNCIDSDIDRDDYNPRDDGLMNLSDDMLVAHQLDSENALDT